jgi:hypothetical protein
MGVLVVHGRQVNAREQILVLAGASRPAEPVSRRQPLGQGYARNVVLVDWNGDVDVEVPRNEVVVSYCTEGGAARQVIVHVRILEEASDPYQHVPQLTL